jgi:hypothetical protein
VHNNRKENQQQTTVKKINNKALTDPIGDCTWLGRYSEDKRRPILLRYACANLSKYSVSKLILEFSSLQISLGLTTFNKFAEEHIIPLDLLDDQFIPTHLQLQLRISFNPKLIIPAHSTISVHAHIVTESPQFNLKFYNFITYTSVK